MRTEGTERTEETGASEITEKSGKGERMSGEHENGWNRENKREHVEQKELGVATGRT